MLPNVLHGLAKNRVIHEFEEVFLKVILCLSSKLGVEIYVRFQLCTLLDPIQARVDTLCPPTGFLPAVPKRFIVD